MASIYKGGQGSEKSPEPMLAELDQIKNRFLTEIENVKKKYLKSEHGLTLFVKKEGQIGFAIDMEALKNRD